MFAYEATNQFSQPGTEPVFAALLGLRAAPEADLRTGDKHPELRRTPRSARWTRLCVHVFTFRCRSCHDVSCPGTFRSRASPPLRAGAWWVQEWLECGCCSTVFCSAITCRFLSDCREKNRLLLIASTFLTNPQFKMQLIPLFPGIKECFINANYVNEKYF